MQIKLMLLLLLLLPTNNGLLMRNAVQLCWA